jgi:hypothetical protein
MPENVAAFHYYRKHGWVNEALFLEIDFLGALEIRDKITILIHMRMAGTATAPLSLNGTASLLSLLFLKMRKTAL